MIFYVALDENGHRQLRGTQADARAVNKQFEQIDLPTDKAGLMALVQDLYSQIDQRPCDPAPVVAAEPLEAPVPPPAPEAPPPPVQEEEAPLPSKFQPIVLMEQVEMLGEKGYDLLDDLDKHQAGYGVGAAFSRGVHFLNVLCSGEHQLARLFLKTKRKP